MRHVLILSFLLLGIMGAFAQDKMNLPNLSFEHGKVTYLVGNDNEAETSNLLDVLQKYPFIAIDEKGAITLNGSPDFGLSIDGQPFTLNSSILSTTLRYMPARLVEKVEVITQPSYSLLISCSAGVINIITKKSKTEETAASIGGNVNSNGCLGGNILFNLKRESTSFNGSYSTSTDNDVSVKNINSRRVKSNYQADLSSDKTRQLNLNYAWQVSKNDMFSVFFNLVNDKQICDEKGHYSLGSSSGSDDIIFKSTNKFSNVYMNVQAAYNHQFSSTGALFSLMYYYSKYTSNINQFEQNISFDTRSCDRRLSGNGKDYFISAEYKMPLGIKNQLLFGAKYSKSNFIENKQMSSYNQEEKRSMDIRSSSIEAIFPFFYLQYDLKLKRFLLTAAIRSERTYDRTWKKENNILPSINMMYKLSRNAFVHADLGSYLISNDNLSANYSNELTIHRKIDKVHIGYNLDKNKFQVMLDAFYSSWVSKSFRIISLASSSDAGIVLLSPNNDTYNSNKIDLYGALAYRLNSNIKMQLSSSLGYFDEKLMGNIKTGFVGNVVLSSWVNLPYGISLNANGGYYFPRNDYYLDSREYYTYRFRLTRNFFNNKLTSSIYANNLFTTDNVQLVSKMSNANDIYNDLSNLTNYYKETGHEVGVSMVYHF